MPVAASRTALPRARSLKSEHGSILMLTALSMVVMLGMVALAIDGSFMFTERNRMSAAADAGAKSAALAYFNDPLSNLQAFADREATAHGFDPGATTTVTVNRPPSTGRFTANQGYVEVIVSRPTATFFARVLDAVWASMTPAARAVAGASSGPFCMIALDENGDPSLYIGQTVVLNSPGCSIAANGNLRVGPGSGGGSGVIDAASIGVQGTCAGRCTDSELTTNVGAAYEDPLIDLAAPASPGVATPVVVGNNEVATIPAGAHSSISIGQNSTVTFAPGLHYLTGPMIFGNQATVVGSEVMFYFAGTAAAGPCTPAATAGCIDIPNGATVTLSAQTSGDYEGILFFQSRTNAIDANFNNAGIYDLSGAMYFPAASVSYGNAGASNDCTLFVANKISLGSGGGGSMDFSNTCSDFGGSPLLTVSLAE